MAGLSAQEELIVLKKRARRRLVGAVVLVLVATAVLWRVVGRVPAQQMKPESVEILGAAASSAPAAAASAPLPASAGTALAAARPAAATALPESLSTMAADEGEASAPPTTRAAPIPVKPAPAVETEPVVVHTKKPAREASSGRAAHPPRAEAPAPAAVRHADPAAILEGRDSGATDAAPGAAAAPAGEHMMIQLAALSDQDKADALRAKLSALGVNARFSKVDTSKGPVTRVRVGPFASRAEADAVLRKLARAGVTGIIVSRP
ncbi:SPOR domain-containing protein [Paludibacterium yongneupense]|uniref:SPOR domain-containing protein n=1 Tax=Paludibacterium yongneupense TaxID=400061 RepID=UPI000401DC84|nr:SPOR domain-containing protein [Paludibacterium yongneupense]